MKETIKGYEKAVRNVKKKQEPSTVIIDISKEQFNLKQRNTELGNIIWKSENEIAGNSRKINDLQKEKEDIFITILGIKEIKDLTR